MNTPSAHLCGVGRSSWYTFLDPSGCLYFGSLSAFPRSLSWPGFRDEQNGQGGIYPLTIRSQSVGRVVCCVSHSLSSATSQEGAKNGGFQSPAKREKSPGFSIRPTSTLLCGCHFGYRWTTLGGGWELSFGQISDLQWVCLPVCLYFFEGVCSPLSTSAKKKSGWLPAIPLAFVPFSV